MSNAMLFLSLLAVWLGINILFLVFFVWRARIVPRWDDDAPGPIFPATPPRESPRPVRRERGSFTAPIVHFNPSTRTAIKREHLTALTKAGDRSARNA